MDRRVWPTGITPSGRGLRVRITKGRFEVYSKTIPCDPTKKSSLSAAIRHRNEILSRIHLGIPLYSDGEGKKQFYTWAQEYMNSLECKRSTHLSYENIINQRWIPAFGNIFPDEITTRQIKEELSKMKIAAKTKKNVLIPLAGILSYAEVNPNPVAPIRIKSAQKAPIQRYVVEERDKLMKKLKGQEAAYFAVLFGCGLRPGEALGLEWTDYDGEQINVSKQITRRRTQANTKTNYSRKVYVPLWVRPYLNELPSRFQGGHIFVNSFGRPCLDTDIFNSAWRDAHKKARIPYRIPYTCRHTRAAELLSIGIAPGDAAKQLGHSLEMFYRTYAEWIGVYAGKNDLSRFEVSSGKNLAKNDAKGGEYE